MDEFIYTEDLLWIINSLPQDSPEEWIPSCWLERRERIVAHLENIIDSRKEPTMRHEDFNQELEREKERMREVEEDERARLAEKNAAGLEEAVYESSNFRTMIPMSQWQDISDEQWRQYRFPDGEVIKIEHPKYLNVSKSGGHRIFDGRFSHYVPAGWLHLVWLVKEGHNHFAF